MCALVRGPAAPQASNESGMGSVRKFRLGTAPLMLRRSAATAGGCAHAGKCRKSTAEKLLRVDNTAAVSAFVMVVAECRDGLHCIVAFVTQWSRN